MRWNVRCHMRAACIRVNRIVVICSCTFFAMGQMINATAIMLSQGCPRWHHPGMEPAAQCASTGLKSPGQCKDSQIDNSFSSPQVVPRGRSQLAESFPNPDELGQNVSKNPFWTKKIVHFFCKSSESDCFFVYLLIRIRFFRPGESI